MPLSPKKCGTILKQKPVARSATLNSAVNHYKPNIHKLINEIKNQQQNFELDFSF